MKRPPLALLLLALLAIIALAVLVWMLLAPKKISAARTAIQGAGLNAARSGYLPALSLKYAGLSVPFAFAIPISVG
jgi:hypothetical protein